MIVPNPIECGGVLAKHIDKDVGVYDKHLIGPIDIVEHAVGDRLKKFSDIFPRVIVLPWNNTTPEGLRLPVLKRSLKG